MKKIFSLVLVLILLIAPFSLNIAFAEGDALNADNTEFSASGFLKNFVTTYPDRFAGTQGEKAAADFIAGKFEEFVNGGGGFAPFNESADGKEKFYQTFDFIDNGITKKSQNVILTKKALSATEKTVVIGAHYDNAYQLPSDMAKEDYGMQGAYDNGTGVAVMMDLLNRAKGENFDYNIVFIAFGGEEFGLKGSDYYAKNLTEEELNNILIMFNLDVIGAGDKLYLYCDEVKTEHETFLLDLAKNIGIELNSPPLDKHVILYQLNDMPYLHTGLMSDNLSFLTRGVNSAFFFTYNWEYGLAESEKYSSMLHSTDDNIGVLKERYPDYEKFMADVSGIIYAALKADSFEEKMISSLNNKFNYRPFLDTTMILIVAAVILTLAGVLVVLTYVSLNKNKSNSKPLEILADPFSETDNSVFGNEFEGDIFK